MILEIAVCALRRLSAKGTHCGICFTAASTVPLHIHCWQSCLYMLYTCCQDRPYEPALLRAARHMLACTQLFMSQTLQGEALPPKTADLMIHSAEGQKQDSGPDNLEGNVHSKCASLASNQSFILSRLPHHHFAASWNIQMHHLRSTNTEARRSLSTTRSRFEAAKPHFTQP